MSILVGLSGLHAMPDVRIEPLSPEQVAEAARVLDFPNYFVQRAARIRSVG